MRRHLMFLGLAVALGAQAAAEDEFTAPLTALATGELSTWVADPAILAALAAQNARHAGLTQEQIEALDKDWRAQIGSASRPMIEETLGNEASAVLRARQEASAGLVTEAFVMDARGLNVAQSTVTSDYWQGDEAKWQDTYGVGPQGVHISEIDLDESSQTYQSQISMTVVDPATGAAVGAVTFGIDVSLLN